MKYENIQALVSERSLFHIGASSPNVSLNRRPVGTVSCRLAKKREHVKQNLCS